MNTLTHDTDAHQRQLFARYSSQQQGVSNIFTEISSIFTAARSPTLHCSVHNS